MEEPICINTEEMAEFAEAYAKSRGYDLSKELALIAYDAETEFLRKKGLIVEE